MATCLAEGGSSVATTVPASDADAVENAKRGCAQAKELEATAPTAAAPSTTARPSLCRVNSVPVLQSPHTPVDRIRRTSTPADLPQSGTGTHEASVTPEESQNGTSPVPEGGATKPKKVVNKKKKKRAKIAQAQDDRKLAPSNEGNQPAAEKEASTTDKTEPASDGNPPQTLDKTTPSDKTTDDSARALASAGAAHQPKPAATKSMARKPGHGEPVKVERTPARTDGLDDLQREQAKANNLRRANTNMQHTPAEGEDDHADLESLLDKEIKKELPADTDPPAAAGELAGPIAPAPPPAAAVAAAPPTETPAPPPAGTPAPPTPPRRVSFAPVDTVHEPQEEEGAEPKKKKREKTEAEKAAHARYMRFSRSFKRILH